MKRHLITFLFLLLALQGLAQQEIYDKYAYREDVLVALVRNIQFDSTHTVDGLLLRAMDDNGWQWMVEEFDLGHMIDRQADDDSPVKKHLVRIIRSTADITLAPPMLDGKVDYSESCLILLDVKERTLLAFFALDATILRNILFSNL